MIALSHSLQVETLLLIIWDSLMELDDLSASTNSIMNLLCTLLSSNPSISCSNLAVLVPRLWPFLAHTISSVRKSCLIAILTILACGSHGNLSEEMESTDQSGGKNGCEKESELAAGEGTERLPWLREVLQSMLCHVFQRFALEGVEENRELIHKVST